MACDLESSSWGRACGAEEWNLAEHLSVAIFRSKPSSSMSFPTLGSVAKVQFYSR